ncbi:MAG: respiratory nitrate reductase subunit gamma [Deltaproteobacteria bacterium]|nr:respiratory nitrate reductase subunit gamma [Deltaproteobacteria bacterium]
MHTIYAIVTGPLVWAAFIIFIGGSLYRLINMIVLAYRTEEFIFTYISLKYSLRSIIHWMTPFATVNMRKHPILTIVSFAFHICLLLVPIFLLSHIILWDESWNLSWLSLPDPAADIMTMVVIGGCVFFMIRRITRKEVKYVTSASDYVLLAIVAAPFVTGFIAYHQWFYYQLFAILHILTAEVMLIAIPFTRLSHMIFSLFTRAYMGSEFGGIRHARDW